MTMQPFNLDRFKAGEPAYDKETNVDVFYVDIMPDGRIAFRILHPDGWRGLARSPQELDEDFYMKEKELTWDKVSNMWANDKIDRTVFFEWLDANFEPPKLKKK